MAQRLSRNVRTFLDTEAAGGTILLVVAVVALAWANSPWHGAYDDVWHWAGLRHWVNDGAMAVFFLVVGLEVKRELVAGELREWRKAALPVVAAAGGMVVPALLYAALNAGGDGARGWGVPMATDIAFASGLLALLGTRVPSSLKLFVLTLAVADDIGAIVVIAAFYGEPVDPAWLAGAAAVLAAIAALHRAGVGDCAVHAALGVGLWVCTYQSGVHATIAGVALGLVTPVEPLGGRLERSLHPWTSLLIVPVFALANAGVRVADVELSGEGLAVAGGVVAGLVVGKFAGVLAFAAVAVRTGLGTLPDGLTWRHVAGAAGCAGIGFTVSLFVAGLAFDDGDPLAGAAKVGILTGSVAAAAIGSVVLLGCPAAAPGERTPSWQRSES